VDDNGSNTAVTTPAITPTVTGDLFVMTAAVSSGTHRNPTGWNAGDKGNTLTQQAATGGVTRFLTNSRHERTKNLMELKGAQMIGCEFCVDLGSQICRNSGFSDEELLALPRYRQSDLFTEREKTALDYAVGVMRTPVDVSDELFHRMGEHFSDEQMVELTALMTVVNLDRFNAAFGIGSSGFSEGMVCVLPDRPAVAPEVARAG
jgi:alkylhydroperoxidase family enzyme